VIACPTCGYPNDESEYRCERCGRRFDAPALAELGALALWPEEEDEAEPGRRGDPAPAPQPAAVAAAAPGSPRRPPAPEPSPWREEVASRLEQFRERRRAQGLLPLDFADAADPAASVSSLASTAPRPAGDRSGKVIPFEQIAGGRALAASSPALPPAPRNQPPPLPKALQPPVPAGPAVPAPVAAPPTPAPVAQRPRVRGASASQGSLTFPGALPSAVEAIEFPVAPVEVRAIAAAVDAALLACGCGAFLGLYSILGGEFSAHRFALAALAGSLALLAFLYGFLFLYFSNATPGMRWMGLRILDFDGEPARRGQRLVRLFGLMAGGAALGVGFLWAALDEQGLTWHDRISRTCLAMGDPTLGRRR